MLQRLLSAVFTKLDCSIFSLMFLLFRWREAYLNGTGRWIYKKTGVRKTTVIASIMFLTELVLFFTEMIPEHSLPGSAHTRAIPSVARPIFVSRIKAYVMTILNHMLSCFRSNYKSTESGFKKIRHQYKIWLLWRRHGRIALPHVQFLLPWWKGMLLSFWIICSLVSDPKTGSRGEYLTK